MSGNGALIASVAFLVGIVGFVHYNQKSEKRRMHEGKLRDEERRLWKLAQKNKTDQQDSQSPSS